MSVREHIWHPLLGAKIEIVCSSIQCSACKKLLRLRDFVIVLHVETSYGQDIK